MMGIPALRKASPRDKSDLLRERGKRSTFGGVVLLMVLPLETERVNESGYVCRQHLWCRLIGVCPYRDP